MKMSFIEELQDSYSAKLDLLNPNAKISIEEASCVHFNGLLVYGKLFKVQMSYKVKLVSCKIHRKSGFVMLALKMSFSPFKTPIINIKQFPKARPDDLSCVSRALGMMFMGTFQKVKMEGLPISSIEQGRSTYLSVYGECANFIRSGP
jgi:hypothetical protein